MSKILKGLVPFAAAAMFSGVASAGPAIIDVQQDYDGGFPGGDADSLTGTFSQMGVQFNSISEVLLSNPLNGLQVGDTFTDSGYGIVSPLLGTGTDFNEFATGGLWGIGGQLTFWFDDIQGEYIDVDPGPGVNLLPTYTGGSIHFMFDDANDGAYANSFGDYNPFLNMNATASQAEFDAEFGNHSDSLEILTVSNLFGGAVAGQSGFTLLLNGDVETVAPSWFVDALSGKTFDELLADLVDIAFMVDFNDDNAVAEVETECGPNGGDTCLLRYSDHNGSASFQVPAPGVLALMGLGLFGMGAVSRKRSKKVS